MAGPEYQTRVLRVGDTLAFTFHVRYTLKPKPLRTRCTSDQAAVACYYLA